MNSILKKIFTFFCSAQYKKVNQIYLLEVGTYQEDKSNNIRIFMTEDQGREQTGSLNARVGLLLINQDMMIWIL